MSGKKDVFVSMTREQRDRLIATTRDAFDAAAAARRLGVAQQEAQELSDTCISNLMGLLHNQVNGANEEIRRLANDQNRRLREQARNFRNDINELRRQREKDREELLAEIHNVQERIEAKERNHRAIAEDWIAQAEAYFADIEQYRHELFAPNQLSHLRTLLSQVAEDIKNEAFQSAISASRNVFNQAVDLKERVVSAEIEWAHYHGEFRHLFANIESAFYHYQNLRYKLPTQDGEQEVEANVDYWADGALSEIEREISDIRERTNQIQELSTAELMALITALRNINTRMEETGDKAKEALICSQVRAELADSLARTLQESGWEYVGYTYEGSEMNAALHIKLRDNLGNEIVTVITPEMNRDALGNNMEFNFFSDYNNDENTRNIWIAAIIEQLRRAGLNVGKPQTKPGYENRSSDNEALRDLEATAQRKTR